MAARMRRQLEKATDPEKRQKLLRLLRELKGSGPIEFIYIQKQKCLRGSFEYSPQSPA